MAKSSPVVNLNNMAKQKKSERGRQMNSGKKKEKQRTESSNARLQDLCPEDKAKIGELVKKLAGESKEKMEA